MNREVAALRALTDAGAAVPEVFDVFEVEGINGKHLCYAMSVSASSLDSVLRGYDMPIEIARAVCARIDLIISTIHSGGYCHGGEEF
jgi:tRNA A-37 threonylcarbamoyl transferase component Bud32